MMNADELKRILEELRFTADFPQSVLVELASHAKHLKILGGEVVFREGNKNDNLFLVRSGSVALEMTVHGRGAVRILTMGPGEMVGWSSLMNGGSMTATAVALEDTEFVVAPAEKLRSLCEENHDFGYHLMRQMARVLSKRLLATRLQLLDLFADAPPSTSDQTFGA